MNREIKFRGFVKELNQWVVGDLLSNNNQPIIVKQVERNYISTTDVGQGKHWAIETPAYKVVPESVGQFTDLTDKNGVEIYFDDLYIDEDGDVFKVMQMECGRYALERWNDGYVDEFIDWKCVEIIGNLFQNSELLKQ